MPEVFQYACKRSTLGLLSQVLCGYSQNLSAYQWMYLQLELHGELFLFCP